MQASPKSRLWRHAPLLVILTVSVIGYVFLHGKISIDTLRQHQQQLLDWRAAHLGLAAVSFVLVYVVIVAFSLPGAAIASITGGFLFGLWGGTVLNVLAASIGAMIIFAAVRVGLGQALTARIDASEGKIKKLKTALAENEISVLFILRLVPVVPFFVANVVPALVGVRFANYALTTVLGIIPGGIVYTSIGSGLSEVFARGEHPNLSVLTEPYVIGPLLGLIVLALLPILLKQIRQHKGL